MKAQNDSKSVRFPYDKLTLGNISILCIFVSSLMMGLAMIEQKGKKRDSSNSSQDIQHNPTSGSRLSTFPLEKKVLDIKRSKVIRLLYVTGGTISLLLAIIGIVVPGLPTTPFALLAAFLYAKSSKKLYDWLLRNRVLGPRIKNYQRRKGVTRKGKIGVIAFMTLMVLFSSFVVVRVIPIRIVILSLGLIGTIVVWFFVPTAQDD